MFLLCSLADLEMWVHAESMQDWNEEECHRKDAIHFSQFTSTWLCPSAKGIE